VTSVCVRDIDSVVLLCFPACSFAIPQVRRRFAKLQRAGVPIGRFTILAKDTRASGISCQRTESSFG